MRIIGADSLFLIILIGGFTDLDGNLTALEAALALWDSADSYAARTAALASTFNASTVHDNGVSDHLEGEGALDWYFASLGDKLDKHSKGEVVTTIS